MGWRWIQVLLLLEWGKSFGIFTMLLIFLDMVGSPERGFVEYSAGEFHHLMPLLPLDDFSMFSGQSVFTLQDVLSSLRVLDSTGTAAVSAFDFLQTLGARSLLLIPLSREDYERVGQGGGFLRNIALGTIIDWSQFVLKHPTRHVIRKWLGRQAAAPVHQAMPDPLLELPRGAERYAKFFD